MAKEQLFTFHEFTIDDDILVASITFKGRKEEIWIDELDEDGERRYYFRMLGKESEEVLMYFTITEHPITLKDAVKFGPVHRRYKCAEFDPKGIYDE